MSGPLIRQLTVAALLGLVGNFLIYDFSSRGKESFMSEWHSPVGKLASISTASESVKSFLRVEKPSEVNIDTVAQREDRLESRQFTFQGVTYRLSGLVISSTGGAATLIADNLDPIRVGAGDAIPSGELIESIDLNQIALIAADGKRESLRIY